ncbi:hypothetical protein [Sphingobacterium anhuiense]|uniref:hypothetical protein n=1 Tax=Sphingobacterium anhuiense TaxID=493780 RepID=UPI003C2FB426
MKNLIKKYALAIIAVLIAGTSLTAAGLNKSENKEHPKATGMVWYSFDQHIDSDPNNPSNYTRLGTSNTAGCAQGSALCSINASDNGATPDATELAALQTAIANGSQTSQVTFKN